MVVSEGRRQAAVEAGARALRAAAATALSDPSWDEIDEPLRSNYRMRAAAVIDAAAPHLVDEAVGYAMVHHDKTGDAWVTGPGDIYPDLDAMNTSWNRLVRGTRVALVPVDET